ncbi:MAG: glycosyltransferase family 4 protein [Verrucomicrobiota bacterium]|nr:glycosyltransferase family 4 protein [Verrucomicrobiota bacterium]
MSQEKPCVCIIVENLPVPLDRRVWQESCALRDAGYEVVVICPQMRGFNEPEEVIDGIQVYRHWISEEAGAVGGFLREYSSALWGEFRLLWKAWRRHRFDVVHLCNPPDLLFLVAAPYKLAGTRIIYDVHDVCPEMFEAKFGKRGLLYWAVRVAEWSTHFFADIVIATNESVRDIALDRGGQTPGNVFVVRTAPKIVDTKMKPDGSLKKGRPHLVGYVGVMGNADGVRYIIEAAHHLVHKLGRDDIQFLLMGSGPEHDNLVALRDELGLDDFIDLPGRVTNEFLFTALRTIDLGVSSDPINPYNNHCTMNKVLEYMTFAKPQVMFDLKEGRFSAGDAARYVPENSAQALGQAIAETLDDPGECERMGRLGHERFHTQLNWEKSVEQLEAAYARALGQG